MAYIPNNLKVTKEDMNQRIEAIRDGSPIPASLLVMIDYVYHKDDNDYDKGLSFFRRLHDKLGHLHPDWDVEQMIDEVMLSNDPVDAYMGIIEDVLLANQSDIVYYGL